MLLIVGGNGDSRRYVTLSALMASSHTVVRYDRRANFRSTGDMTVDLDLAQQARDAAALIRTMDAGPAYVFGNSAGANIAIKLTEDHPDVVKALVAHEPPITGILPDAAQHSAFMKDVRETFVAQGAGPAMKKFMGSFVGMDKTAEAPADQGGNMEHFMAHEFLSISRYVPDLDRVRRGGVPVVTAVGRASGDAFYVQTARAMAEQLGCPCVEMSGNHVAFALQPGIFAAELSEILGSFRTPAVTTAG
ncbi:alpha/beta hydrolase [Caballeronia sp. dw_19]|uniref:alpha/beta fold hydrolase n=1 Tax=Caballeronia sp. dw_19 TaxID=2719791 RepID=UPI001BD507B6|nr:alpha/beta hydrolase [Caballeronia sp. dw_19]